MPTSQKKPVDCSELAASLAELALAHGEAGAKTLDDVVAAMKRDGLEVDRDTIADAIVAFTRRNKPVAMTKDEAKERIKELKATARRDAELRKQIEDLRNRSTREVDAKKKKVYDDRVTALESERGSLRKSIAAEKSEAHSAGKLEAEIADLEQQMATGEFKTKTPSEQKVYSEKIAALRERRAGLRESVSEKNAEIKTEARLTEEIADLTEQLETGNLKDAPAREKKTYSDKIEALRAQRAELKDEIGKIKGEQGFEKRLQDQIKELQRKLDEGDLAPPPSRAKRVLTERAEQLQYERDRLKKEINREIEKAKPPGVFKTFFENPANEIRALMTTGEMSAVLRQGGFLSLGNPGEAAKAAVEMMKAFKSGRVAHKIDMSLRPGNPESRPNAMLYEKSKLHLPDPEIVNNPKRSEEAFQTDLPMLKAISKVLKMPIPRVIEAFGRSYITFLNIQRANRFDAMVATLAKNGEPTPAEAKAIAGFINAVTGRGNLGQLERSASVLNTTFFAPRYVASRFETILEPVLAAARTGATKAGFEKYADSKSAWSGSRETDKLIAKEYAKYALGMGLVISAASQVPGVEIEHDPRSSDFGKIRIGDTRLDMMSGFQQAAVFLAKQISSKNKSAQTGEVEDMDARRWLANLTRFARTKLAPLPSTVLDLKLGEDVVGEAVNPTRSIDDALKFGAGLVFPITYHDIYKVLTGEYGLDEKMALSLTAMLGAGVQSYDPLKPKTPSDKLTIPKEERDLDPDLPASVTLNSDEYARLLQAHERALAEIEKERKKPYFAKLPQKEKAAEIDALYRDEFEQEKKDIVLDAVGRLMK